MSFFKEIFAWWHGNTWGTRLTIWNQGRFVGEDDFGNRYYEQRKGVAKMGEIYSKLLDEIDSKQKR